MNSTTSVDNGTATEPIGEAADTPISTEESVAMVSAMLPADDMVARTLVENLHEGVYFVDTERRIQYWNKGAERISGYKSDEVAGKCCGDDILCHIDKEGYSLCHGMCPLAATIKDGMPRSADVFLHHKDGHRVPVRVSVAQLCDGEGKVIGGLEAFEDLSATPAALEAVPEDQRDALICPLTGAANRKYSETVLLQKMEDSARNETCLGVLFVEVDGFEALQGSRKVADIILKMVGKTLAGSMRSCDFLGRWSDSGFLAILPGLESALLNNSADQIRVRVQKSAHSITKGKIGVTVSIAVRMCRPTDTVTVIDDLATESMAKAGKDRRNCVMTLG